MTRQEVDCVVRSLDASQYITVGVFFCNTVRVAHNCSIRLAILGHACTEQQCDYYHYCSSWEGTRLCNTIMVSCCDTPSDSGDNCVPVIPTKVRPPGSLITSVHELADTAQDSIPLSDLGCRRIPATPALRRPTTQPPRKLGTWRI